MPILQRFQGVYLRDSRWTLFITNAPVKLVSLPEALVLSRVRWQVELLYRSLPKAAKAVAKFAVELALALPNRVEPLDVLSRLQMYFRDMCRMNRRKKHPNTYQLLLALA